jgi:hypothetical protein
MGHSSGNYALRCAIRAAPCMKPMHLQAERLQLLSLPILIMAISFSDSMYTGVTIVNWRFPQENAICGDLEKTTVNPKTPYRLLSLTRFVGYRCRHLFRIRIF